ncbi:hypothetical protein ANCDUO_01998 [Ancylostoma duodenale]|uniref:Uncharacterized protein n=1 Tax=Ancylostoma duodenale TaxID=51022 RepID=A0A0C2HDP4_9BILA|nr:hypothetical protein ANCDUO_01998 [Ancylostoma duodenale]
MHQKVSRITQHEICKEDIPPHLLQTNIVPIYATHANTPRKATERSSKRSAGSQVQEGTELVSREPGRIHRCE